MDREGSGGDPDKGVLASFDSVRDSTFHRKTLIISGMGFFTDAYDIFIIGVVTSLLPLGGWTGITNLDISILDSSSLLAAAIGAIVFGRVIDRIGRGRVYGLEMFLLILGAIGSAIQTPVGSLYALTAWRFILGIGIGGDYASSSVIMTEYSNTKSRGKWVGMVFSMQSIGFLAGPGITLAMLYFSVPASLLWRLLLFFGAIPALVVIYYRRKMPETPRYTASVAGITGKSVTELEKYTGMKLEAGNGNERLRKMSFRQVLSDRRLLLLIIGTSLSWFLMDWALYGNTIMSDFMLKSVVPSSLSGISRVYYKTEITGVIFALFAFPGYWLATFTLDRLGRKFIQSTGFLMMAITFGLLFIFPFLETSSHVVDFVVIYGLSYFFIEFGPNLTTFVYPPEVFPAQARGTGTGIAASAGKIGAFLGTFLNLVIQAAIGTAGLFSILAIFSLLGLFVTVLLLPEPGRKDLGTSSGESLYLTS
ncbi:MAG: MFS transporter [Candidatus Thermoplasmatota archaeon]|nr:MFS transporter [Candidatus Thermoplasmatota archaeon]MCL5790677.1 MFS transporter [Candidatus Thermoplasmatota archaeon]